MKHRLIAGTINHWPDDGEWRNWTLDIAARPIFTTDLECFVMPDFVNDIAHMVDVPDAAFDEVRAHHVLEHLPQLRIELALEEVRRVLRPGGVLDVEVPDIDRVTRAYVADQLDFAGLHQWLYGEVLPEHRTTDSHFTGFSKERLLNLLGAHDFDPGEPLDAGLAVRFRAVRA